MSAVHEARHIRDSKLQNLPDNLIFQYYLTALNLGSCHCCFVCCMNSPLAVKLRKFYSYKIYLPVHEKYI